MKAEIINIGTELLLGDIVNTNATYLAKGLRLLGIELYHISTLGDNHQRLIEQLEIASQRSDLIILTGGLGPTLDDMTKEGVAQFFKRDLVFSEEAKSVTDSYFHFRQISQPKLNERQYYIPQNSGVIPNPNGTACGLILEDNNLICILLPGPPIELKPMFDNYIAPWLSKKSTHHFKTIDYRLRGIGESKVAEVLNDLISNQSNPSLATYAATAEVHLRLMLSQNTLDDKLYQDYIKYQIIIEERLGNYIFTKTNEDFMDVLINKIKGLNWTISFAESCSGGGLVSRFIEYPGTSQIINESYITYSNDAKERILGVQHQTLLDFGAVSSQTASEMALGVSKKANSQIGLSITGIAGPSGGSDDKPVGLVYIGCAINGNITTKELHLKGNRKLIQKSAIENVLTLLWKELNNLNK